MLYIRVHVWRFAGCGDSRGAETSVLAAKFEEICGVQRRLYWLPCLWRLAGVQRRLYLRRLSCGVQCGLLY